MNLSITYAEAVYISMQPEYFIACSYCGEEIGPKVSWFDGKIFCQICQNWIYHCAQQYQEQKINELLRNIQEEGRFAVALHNGRIKAKFESDVHRIANALEKLAKTPK